MVYKGFVPRTSDHYIKMLKEVSWSEGKKGQIKGSVKGNGVYFNSQF